MKKKTLKNNGYCIGCSMMLIKSDFFDVKYCGNRKCPRQGLYTCLVLEEPKDE